MQNTVIIQKSELLMFFSEDLMKGYEREHCKAINKDRVRIIRNKTTQKEYLITGIRYKNYSVLLDIIIKGLKVKGVRVIDFEDLNTSGYEVLGIF